MLKSKKSNHVHYLFSVIAISLLAVGGVLCVSFYGLTIYQAAYKDAVLAAVRYGHSLDGSAVATKFDASAQVIGVMIDNHPDARPQAGLSKAKIVYEAMVEGGITRYFVIYDAKQNIAEIGPVRSARLYFLDWLQEYGDALYVHSGGSPQALAAIGPRKVFDANEFFFGKYYWRQSGYFAPHNLFTSTDKLDALIAQSGKIPAVFNADQAWKYSAIVGKTFASNSTIIIPFSIGYEAGWTYDAKNLNYLRNINGRVQRDKDKSEVRTRNILIQFTEVGSIANDDKGRQEIKTVGSGDAIILKKGSVVYGTWKKKSVTDRTRFYGNDGKEVVLTPGNTWVEVVPTGTNVSVSSN